jgi:basic amino acid/polyamine antiporter, APA family
MVNVGTMFAFVLVSAGVIILRRTRPELPRAFRIPTMPLIPILSVLACLWLMIKPDGRDLAALRHLDGG